MATDQIKGGPGSYPVKVERDCNTCAHHKQAGPQPAKPGFIKLNFFGEGPSINCVRCLDVLGVVLPNWSPLEPHWISK